MGKGGGAFGGWDDLVTNWDRNLFTGMEAAPEVSAEEYLVMLDNPAAAGATPGADFTWLEIAGLDRKVRRRGLAIVAQETGASLARENAGVLRVFEPITDRRISPHGIDN